MYFRKNFLGITAFILTFVATAFILVPQVFPKTVPQSELEQSQESFENYIADTALGIREKLRDRLRTSDPEASEDLLETTEPRAGVLRRFLEGIRSKEVSQDAQKDVPENAAPPSEKTPEPVSQANLPPDPPPFDWRENLPRAGFLLGVVALFVATLSLVRREDKVLSRSALMLSLLVVGSQVLSLLLDTLMTTLSIIAICLVIAAALHLLSDGGLEV